MNDLIKYSKERNLMSNRREEILDAFIRLIGRYGIDKTTMQELAKEAGISVGTIYNDFTSKEELIDAFCQRIEAQATQGYDYLLAQDESSEIILYSIITKHIEAANHMFRNNRGFIEITKSVHNFKHIGRKVLGVRSKIKEAVLRSVISIMERGVRAGQFEITDIPHTAALFLDAVSEYWSPPFVEERDQEEIMRDTKAMVSLLLRAIKKPSNT